MSPLFEMRASLRKKSFAHLTDFIQKANMCQVLGIGMGGTQGRKIQGGAGKLGVRRFHQGESSGPQNAGHKDPKSKL